MLAILSTASVAVPGPVIRERVMPLCPERDPFIHQIRSSDAAPHRSTPLLVASHRFAPLLLLMLLFYFVSFPHIKLLSLFNAIVISLLTKQLLFLRCAPYFQRTLCLPHYSPSFFSSSDNAGDNAGVCWENLFVRNNLFCGEELFCLKESFCARE